MNIDKLTGSYYTPLNLVQAMKEYINLNNVNTILEPSAGDGRIIKKFVNNKSIEIDGIEFIEEKSINLKNIFKLYDNVNIINDDFIMYSMNSRKKYDLIIGNPPYINKKYLSDIQKENIKKVYKDSSINYYDFNNIWNAFLLSSINLVNNNGTIFFVLPIEFLQSNHSESLRNLILNKFNIINIFIFKEKVFEDISQSICLLFLSNHEKNKDNYITYNLVKDYDLKKPIIINKINKNNILDKWTNLLLLESEMDFVINLSNKFMKINELGKIAPGVVTGANSYFILSNEFVKNNFAEKYVKPIISKSSYLKNTFIIDEEKFEKISSKNKCNLLLLNDIKKEEINNRIKRYILSGEVNNIHKRFKCSKRKCWYHMPKCIIGDIVFFKRYDLVPKLVVNKIGCYTTDLGYNIKLNKEYDANSVVFCFYNSLTLALCEIKGRYYGGGVQELTPREFKELRIPYKKIHHNQIKKFNKMMELGMNINYISNYVDSIVLKENVSDFEIKKLNGIREKYINRRKR